jgi:hypothetical protein
MDRIKAIFSRSESGELRRDEEHRNYTDSHHVMDEPKQHMQDRIDPD